MQEKGRGGAGNTLSRKKPGAVSPGLNGCANRLILRKNSLAWRLFFARALYCARDCLVLAPLAPLFSEEMERPQTQSEYLYI